MEKILQPNPSVQLQPLSKKFLQRVYEDLISRFGTASSSKTAAEISNQVHPTLIQLPLLDQRKVFDTFGMCEVAAAYFMTIAKRKPFDRQTLRVALAASLAFLHQHHIFLRVSEIRLFEMCLDAAFQEANERDFAEFLLENVQCTTTQCSWRLDSIEMKDE